MKKVLVLLLSLIMGMAVLCGCGEDVLTASEQTGNLKYEIAEGWDAKAVSPSPSTVKVYRYGDCTVRIEALSYRFYENPLQEALDNAVGEALAGNGGTIDYESGVPAQDSVGGMPAKEVVIESILVDDTKYFSGIFTAVETEAGVYTISSITSDEQLGEDIKTAHRALLDTVEYVSERDPEVYAKNVFQFAGYISAIPEWDEFELEEPVWSSRVGYSDGMINYVSGADMASLTIVPMDKVELTDDVIVGTLQKIYNGRTGPEAGCSIINREMQKAAAGSALYVKAGLDFGEEQGGTVETSAVFVMNEDGEAVCCLSNTSDYECKYDYEGITGTMRAAEPVYGAIESLYSKAGDYAGDNSAVGGLLNDLGFGLHGEYTFELQTAEEPYGVTVKYNEDVGSFDFQREAVMLIGLIGNLDYVDITDADSNVVHYDYELVKHLMKYDVKKMASDKARLGCYYLETLY